MKIVKWLELFRRWLSFIIVQKTQEQCKHVSFLKPCRSISASNKTEENMSIVLVISFLVDKNIISKDRFPFRLC